MRIRTFEPGDEEAVIALWEACDLTRPWNDPRKDITRKLSVDDELFLVGIVDDQVVATVMAGYDGHRGWINYLAVDPGRQRIGLGRIVMDAAEQRLSALGCPKINLQVRTANSDALAFYEQLGYTTDAAVSLGKRIEPDATP